MALLRCYMCQAILFPVRLSDGMLFAHLLPFCGELSTSCPKINARSVQEFIDQAGEGT